MAVVGAIAERLGITGLEVIEHADLLLSRARSLDPLGGWARVIRHAAPKQQDQLKGLPRLCLDLRRAAEVLILFAADLDADVPATGDILSAPFDDRISRHGEHLDSALQAMSISPHTRVVLIVEGETEVLLAHKVLEHFGYDPEPEGLQVIPMRGVSNRERVLRLAAHLAIPTIVRSHPDSYDTLRPLCQVFVATDPEKPMDDPEGFKRRLLGEVSKGLADQDVTDVSGESLGWLVRVTTWAAAFELEHFTDDEIAGAMLELEPCPLPAGSSLDQATRFVADTRANGRSLKKHLPGLSKTRMAEKLWPVLRNKIDTALRKDEPMPPFAEVVYGSHQIAAQSMDTHWVLERRG